MSNPTQFLRLYGYPRGQRSAANTVGSILAEGLREETHISHLSMKALKIKCLLLVDQINYATTYTDQGAYFKSISALMIKEEGKLDE